MAEHQHQESGYATPVYMPSPPAPESLEPEGPVSVFGREYCSPYVRDLHVVSKLLSVSDKHFNVMDINGNVIFTVKGHVFTMHDRRRLIDADGNTIATFRAKLVSLHDRWKVFRGDSDHKKDLIFTAKRSSMVQMKTNLDVFLANRGKDKQPDFRVAGSWLERSCIIYAGDNSNISIVAQMHEKITASSLLLGKEQFGVTVYPYMDYAFIVSLIVILDAVNKED